jgi:DNA repair exonuclease SbcCD ATPase subunit
MRQQLTFELQQTQRTLGFIDPNDKQLITSLQEQQAELTNQLKEINAQLKTQGIPIENQEPPTDVLTPKTTNIVPETPTLPSDPNLLIQRRENSATDLKTQIESALQYPPPLPPPFQPIPGERNPQNFLPAESGKTLPPTPFDQDQAWADSPWVPKPSKELAELKQTVDSLRKEITDLKETVKALETQIQLLNRNILLSQPKP